MSKTKGFNFGAVNDTDKDLAGKSGGKFGLNTGYITKLEFTSEAGKNNEPGDAVDLEVQIGDKTFKNRLFDITGDLYGAKNVKVTPEEEGYDALYQEAMKQLTAVITHAIKALGVSQEAIEKKFTQPATSYADWCKKILSLLPLDYKTIPIDIFLEYQWTFGKDSEGNENDKTYLILPKNMKGGRFLCPKMNPVGKWTEVKDEEGLRYVDSANNIHIFDRSAGYMESNKAVQQDKNNAGSNSPFTPNPSTPATGTW
jgi:hypothetical protein